MAGILGANQVLKQRNTNGFDVIGQYVMLGRHPATGQTNDKKAQLTLAIFVVSIQISIQYT